MVLRRRRVGREAIPGGSRDPNTRQGFVKFVNARPFADPGAAARKILELANAVEFYIDNRILIEKINGPFLYELRGTPAEYKAGLDRAIANGSLVLHESGTFVRFAQAGAGLFA